MFFLTLAVALAALAIWQIVQAPGAYRERMMLLKAAATASSDSGSLSSDSKSLPSGARTVPGTRNISFVPHDISFAPSTLGNTSFGIIQMAQ